MFWMFWMCFHVFGWMPQVFKATHKRNSSYCVFVASEQQYGDSRETSITQKKSWVHLQRVFRGNEWTASSYDLRSLHTVLNCAPSWSVMAAVLKEKSSKSPLSSSPAR